MANSNGENGGMGHPDPVGHLLQPPDAMEMATAPENTHHDTWYGSSSDNSQAVGPGENNVGFHETSSYPFSQHVHGHHHQVHHPIQSTPPPLTNINRYSIHQLPPLHHHDQHQLNKHSTHSYDTEVDWRSSPYHPDLIGSNHLSASPSAEVSYGNAYENVNYDDSERIISETETSSSSPLVIDEGQGRDLGDPLTSNSQEPGLIGSEPHPSIGLRPHSTPATLCWLEKNYELCDGVCIPRNVVYFNYVDFCSKNQMQPVNAASFGKIIRQMFANLTTRRLGTRGQSRYHYYGLAVKADSIYYSPNYSNRKPSKHIFQSSRYSGHCEKYNLAHCPNISIPSFDNSTPVNPGFASIQQLPDFPSFREFDQASSIPTDKLQTLIMMYRAHCQRIMDSVNKFSFTEIPHLFTHFWQEIPPHIVGLLGQNIVVTLVGICDAILYRTILKAILPTAIQMFPENVLKIIRKFADDIVGSLQYSLKQVPENLVYVKMKLVKQLSKMLKRRTSVNHLYQAACLVVNQENSSAYEQMITEWKRIDLKRIVDECGTKTCNSEELRQILEKFFTLLEQKSGMTDFCSWISKVFDSFVSKTSSFLPIPGSTSITNQDSCNLLVRIRRFLVIWTSVSGKILKQIKVLSSSNAASSFHLLHLMLNEFLLHEIERLVCEDSMKELMVNMVNSQATELSDSSFIDSLGPDFLSNPNILHSPNSFSIRERSEKKRVSLTQESSGSLGKIIKLEKGNNSSNARFYPSSTVTNESESSTSSHSQ